MSFGAKIATAVVLMGLVAAGAALWFFVFTDKSVTELMGSKETPVAKNADQPTQPAPGQARAAPVWRLNCSDSQAGLDCRAAQTIVVKQTGQPFLTVVVRVPPDTKKPVMLIRAPLGTYLPAGLSLQFGQEAAKTVPFRNCNRSGCVAAYAMSEAEIGSMVSGTNLAMSLQNRQRTPIAVTVPAADFPEAYARMK
jgi:invasion protein IalB